MKQPQVISQMHSFLRKVESIDGMVVQFICLNEMWLIACHTLIIKVLDS